MSLFDDDEKEKKLSEDWKLGEYDNPDNGCVHCGRHRVCICQNGKHRCEKCNWCPEIGDYAPVEL